MLNNLGIMAQRLGDFGSARAQYEQSLDLYRELGDKKSSALQIITLGILAYQQRDYAAARMLYTQSLEISRELDDKKAIVITLNHLVAAVRNQGDYVLAEALQSESLSLSKELGDMAGVAAGLEGIAGVILSRHEHKIPETRKADIARAARLWGAAQRLRDSTGAPLPSSEQMEYDGWVALARVLLSDETFSVAWEGGQVLHWEQAVAYALEDS